MTPKTIWFAAAVAGAAWTLPALTVPASATTLVTSLAAFRAGATGVVTATPNPGNYDLTQFTLPTTSTIALGDGTSLGLPAPAQVTAPQNGFDFLLADGFNGELFVPLDSSGNQATSVTLTLAGGISALGFEVAPFSNSAGAPNFGVPGGPFSVTVTLGNGQSVTTSLPGGNLNTGTTTPAFFGFVGGGVSTLTISTSDRNGFGFGNFVDVPEPASAAVLLLGLIGVAQRRRGERAPAGLA